MNQQRSPLRPVRMWRMTWLTVLDFAIWFLSRSYPRGRPFSGLRQLAKSANETAFIVPNPPQHSAPNLRECSEQRMIESDHDHRFFRAQRQSRQPSWAAGVAQDGKDLEKAPMEAVGCIIGGGQKAKTWKPGLTGPRGVLQRVQPRVPERPGRDERFGHADHGRHR